MQAAAGVRRPGLGPSYRALSVETSGRSGSDGGDELSKYTCLVCGYVYDPEEGDPDNGIDPGTAFEDLPDDWVCPVCGAGKDQFEET